MKPSLVLLHGWGFQSQIWSPLIPYLETKFEVIALDLPGFGNTPAAGKLTLDTMTQSILDKTPTTSIYVGWSLGGLIAMNIAANYPNRISHLITIASSPKFITEDNWPGVSNELINRFANDLQTNHLSTLEQFALLQFYGDKSPREKIKMMKGLLSETKKPSKQVLEESLIILQETDLRHKLKAIQCPQYYTFGRCDILTPPTIAEKLSDLTSNVKTEVFEKMSHAPFLSNPAFCASKIEDFLQ